MWKKTKSSVPGAGLRGSWRNINATALTCCVFRVELGKAMLLFMVLNGVFRGTVTLMLKITRGMMANLLCLVSGCVVTVIVATQTMLSAAQSKLVSIY